MKKLIITTVLFLMGLKMSFLCSGGSSLWSNLSLKDNEDSVWVGETVITYIELEIIYRKLSKKHGKEFLEMAGAYSESELCCCPIHTPILEMDECGCVVYEADKNGETLVDKKGNPILSDECICEENEKIMSVFEDIRKITNKGVYKVNAWCVELAIIDYIGKKQDGYKYSNNDENKPYEVFGDC